MAGKPRSIDYHSNFVTARFLTVFSSVIAAITLPASIPSTYLLALTPTTWADKAAKGRSPRGIRHGSNKLTEGQVLEIRAEKNLKWREIAAKYEISMNMVWLIRSGRNWSHLSKPDDQGTSK